jgi:soluble lytic murein transglycosylase-like protein
MAALPCLGAELAVLKNGFTIQHERRQVMGDVTRLYVSADGASYVDVPTANIDHYEAAAENPASGVRFSPSGSAAAGAGGSGSAAQSPGNLNEVVNEASGRYQLDPDLVNSVIKAESDFNVRAVSPKGAQGLMQLMPQTASQLGVPNAFDAEANVDGGARYLRELLERYNFDLRKALAAYNAGPQRVDQFGGIPPYYETRAYVARIVKDFNKKKIAQGQVAKSAQKSSGSQKGTKKTVTTAKSSTASSASTAKSRAESPSTQTKAQASE